MIRKRPAKKKSAKWSICGMTFDEKRVAGRTIPKYVPVPASSHIEKFLKVMLGVTS